MLSPGRQERQGLNQPVQRDDRPSCDLAKIGRIAGLLGGSKLIAYLRLRSWRLSESDNPHGRPMETFSRNFIGPEDWTRASLSCELTNSEPA